MAFPLLRSHTVAGKLVPVLIALTLLAACGGEPVTETETPDGTVAASPAETPDEGQDVGEGPPPGSQGQGEDGPDPDAFEGPPSGAFEVGSAPLRSGSVPAPFTCFGPNNSLPVDWRDAPEDAVALAIVLVDEDGPDGPRLHWQISNLDPDPGYIPGDSVPPGASLGVNGFGEAAYEGPCSEEGEEHRFVLTAYALSEQMAPPDTADVAAVREAYASNAVSEASVEFTFGRPSE